MSKWPFKIDVENQSLKYWLDSAREELAQWEWGFSGGPGAALLNEIAVEAAMLVVEQSVKFFHAEGPPGEPSFFNFEPSEHPTLVMWPIGGLESLAVTVNLEAVMLHESTRVHDAEQMTSMADCLRRIADRYDAAAKKIDWDALDGDAAQPFEASPKPPPPNAAWADRLIAQVHQELLDKLQKA